MKKRIFVLLLIAATLSVFCALSVSASSRATLFINDSEWADDSLLPFIESDGKMLLPAKAFSSFVNISVTRSDALGSLLFSGGESFLSFNLNFGTCLDEGGNVTDAAIYRYGGEIYLEPYAICEKFGITFESAFAPDGYLAARLKNGEELLDFNTLLLAYSETEEQDIPFLYNPTGKTVSGAFIHPLWLRPTAANVPAVIRTIGNHRVTFALPPSNIKAYASVIPMIYANGNTVAYYMDHALDNDAEKFRAEMEEANKYLFSLVGKTSRIYVSTARPAAIPKIDGYFAKACNVHLVLDDLKNNRMINLALYDSPNSGILNFSVASDRQTRSYYSYFFTQFDRFEALRSMPLSEASSDR